MMEGKINSKELSESQRQFDSDDDEEEEEDFSSDFPEEDFFQHLRNRHVYNDSINYDNNISGLNNIQSNNEVRIDKPASNLDLNPYDDVSLQKKFYLLWVSFFWKCNLYSQKI